MFEVCCDNSGQTCCVFYAETQEAVTMWIDLILEKASRGKFSLMSELNDIQCACNDDEMKRFPDKFTIPLKLVNLVLQPYGFWIKG